MNRRISAIWLSRLTCSDGTGTKASAEESAAERQRKPRIRVWRGAACLCMEPPGVSRTTMVDKSNFRLTTGTKQGPLVQFQKPPGQGQKANAKTGQDRRGAQHDEQVGLIPQEQLHVRVQGPGVRRHQADLF